MGEKNYRHVLMEYIEQQEPETPLTTQMISGYVAEKMGLQIEAVKKAVNVNMGRLARQGCVKRITKGVYCRQIKTVFGDYAASRDVLFCKYLLKDGDEIIGYETGASILNKIGLVSQLPKRTCIATNLYNRLLPGDVNVEVRRPVTAVTKDNYRYLQMLDVIRDAGKYPVDAANPELIIRTTAKELGIDTDRMILYSRKYYKGHLLGKTVDIMLGGLTE